MSMVVFGGLFIIFICLPGMIFFSRRQWETRLKKAIIQARSAKKVPTHFIVRESKPVRWLLLVCSLFFFILLTGLLSQGEIDSVADILGVLILLSGLFYLIAYCQIRRVTVDDQVIHYRSILKKSTFLFEEITKVRFGMNLTLIIYCDKERMFAVETNCAGYYELLSRLIFEGVYFENIPTL